MTTLSAINLSEFRNTPFCDSTIIDVLIRAGFNTLEDIANLTDKEAMSLHGMGSKKYKAFIPFRRVLANNPDALTAYYDLAIKSRVLGTAVIGESLGRRIGSFLSELSRLLDESGACDLAVLVREHFMCGRTVQEISEDHSLGLTVCRERIRQKAVELRKAIMGNSLSKYRISVDESFLDEAALVACNAAGKPVRYLRGSLGDCPDGCFVNFLGLSLVKADLYNASCLGEDYVISPKYAIRDFIDEVSYVIDQLHKDVRPVSIKDILSGARRRMRSLTEEKVASILSSNVHCEQVDGMWQIRYDDLCDYEKAARILWERKDIHFKDVNMYHTIKTGEVRDIASSLRIAKNKYSWAQPVGRTGRWTCGDSVMSDKGIIDVIHSFVESHEVFRFSAAVEYLNSIGFNYPEKTVRCYFTKECRTTVQDRDILCADDKISRHPEYSWRKRNAQIDLEWAMDAMSRCIDENGPSRIWELARAMSAFDETGNFTVRTCAEYISKLLASSDALSRDASGRIHIVHPLVPEAKELPVHYQEVIDIVRTKLLESPSRMLSLATLRDECRDTIAPFAQPTLFYKIISRHCPGDLQKVNVDGKAYLRIAA